MNLFACLRPIIKFSIGTGDLWSVFLMLQKAKHKQSKLNQLILDIYVLHLKIGLVLSQKVRNAVYNETFCFFEMWAKNYSFTKQIYIYIYVCVCVCVCVCETDVKSAGFRSQLET